MGVTHSQWTRSVIMKRKDQVVITELLTHLPDQDREALFRFYVGGQPEAEIAAALGLDADHFRELRRSVKVAFFERTGRGR